MGKSHFDVTGINAGKSTDKSRHRQVRQSQQSQARMRISELSVHYIYNLYEYPMQLVATSRTPTLTSRTPTSTTSRTSTSTIAAALGSVVVPLVIPPVVVV